MLKTGDKIGFLVPPAAKTIIRDYAGGIGFEKTPAEKDAYFLPPLDLAQLAACLQPEFQTFIIDAEAEKRTFSELVELLAEHGAQALVIKVSFPTFSSDIAFIRAIWHLAPVIVPKIETLDTGVLSRLLKGTGTDFCLIAECESNLGEILKGNDIRGTAYLSQEKVMTGQGYLPVGDLDSLPFPDRRLLRQDVYLYPKLGVCTTMLTSRGCPYPCAYYCPYPLTQGKMWRAKSAEKVVEEIEAILKLGIKKILFRDAVFTFDVGRVHRICDLIIARGLNFDWWCETRADKLPGELIAKMASAGCAGINVGVESGDPQLRYARLKRGVSDELLRSVCEDAKKEGVKIAFLLMVGFPGETRMSILKTAELLITCQPYDIGINYPVNYPGTKLNDDALKNGWAEKELAIDDMDGSQPVISTPGLGAGEMIYAKQLLETLFDSLKDPAHKETGRHLVAITEWAKNKN